MASKDGGAELVGMEQVSVDDQIDEHFELLSGFLRVFGERAESLVDYHRTGVDKATIRRHLANVQAEVSRMRALGIQALADVPPMLLRPDVIAAWNSTKNLRYVAGSVMMTERFRADMSPEDRTRAHATKLVYEVLLDTLDDSIDAGPYSFQDAFELLHHCLAPLTTDSFDPAEFRDELRPRLAPEHRHLTDFLTALVAAVQRMIAGSRHGRELAVRLEGFHANWIAGEAFTMYQKDPTVDIRAFLAGCDRFPAPDADLEGIERISGWISHTAAISLIDLCFADRLLSPAAMEEHMTAWFYFDAAVTLLNNLLDPAADLDEGIANLFVIARAKDQVMGRRRVRGWRPSLTMADYEAFLARTATFARRVLEHASRSGDDPTSFYPFIVLMAPIILLTDDDGTREDLVHAYLRAFAHAAAPNVPKPVGVTIPPRTRSGPIRAGRTASS